MAIIDTTEVSILQGVNEQAMNEGMWYLDSGASNHMIGDRRLFQELKEVSQGTVRFGDGSTVGSQHPTLREKEEEELHPCYWL